jgi:NAD(P)-dependent dehydrogenase (short-subunit alcohol dehydrogenase family)
VCPGPNEIKALGGEAVANTDSVSDAPSAARIMQTALDTFGRIDVVVNNAGILRDRFFHKMSVDEFDAVVKVHLYGAYHVSRAASPFFKEQGSGVYIHMTSTSGLIGNFGQANYSAAKLGVAALSKSIALDMHEVQRALQLHCALCLEPHDWLHSHRHTRAAGPGGAHQADDARQDCAVGRVPGQRRRQGRQWPDLCGAQQRNLSDEPAAPAALGAPQRGLDARDRGQPCLPSLKASFFRLDRSGDVFSWDPV